MSGRFAEGRVQAALELLTTETKTNTALAYNQSTYYRWCSVNERAPLQETRQEAELLLLFLHAHHGAWGPGYAALLASAVARLYLDAGQDDPRGGRYHDYMRALRRKLGTRRRPRTDALAASEVAALVTVPPGQPGTRPAEEVVHLRALLAVCEATGQDPTLQRSMRQLAELPRDAFTVTELDVKVRLADGTVYLLDRRRRALAYSAVVEQLNTSTAPRPFLSPSRSPRQLAGEVIPRLCGRVLGWPGRRRPSRVAVRSIWLAADAEELDWWLAHCDPGLGKRARDQAYTVAGVLTAHRHAELGRIRLGDVQATDAGYAWTVTTHKGRLISAQHGRERPPLRRALEHNRTSDATTSQACRSDCPACILGFYLCLRRRAGADDLDALFSARAGRPISVDTGRRTVQRVAVQASRVAGTDLSGRALGTRSFRVTAVTLARMAGMSLPDIAELLTDHVSIATTRLYVRRLDPLGENELTLPLAD